MILIEFINEYKIWYLIIGFITSIFSIGQFNFPLFIYIWPYCFLSYLHKMNSKLIPLLIVSGCLIISNMIRWLGATDMGVLYDFGIGIYFSIINIIPFIIDDLLYNKITKWSSIFIFPLSVTSIEFIFAFIPLGNFNIYAYAIRDNIHMIQISEWFGCYFISFSLALFASILDHSLELYKSKKIISKFVYFYIILYLFIVIFGSIRLLCHENQSKITIASVLGMSNCLYVNKQNNTLSIDEYMKYIEKTIIKARNSEVKILLYSEEAFAIYENDKDEIISRTANLAKENNIFVVLSLDVEYDINYNKNEAILISDEGKILYNYQKQHLIPIVEEDYYEDLTEIKTIDTKLGKIGVAICYDVIFSDYINSLSRKGLDILLMPSWDWKGITEFHSVDLRFRAIENGINIVKSTANGIVLSFDYKGRYLSYYKQYECKDFFVISNVNKKGIKTLYLYIGICFNYFYMAALVIVIGIGLYIKHKEKGKNENIKGDNLFYN